MLQIAKKPMTQDQRERRKKRKDEVCDVENVDDYRGPWASYYHEEVEELPEPTEEQKYVILPFSGEFLLMCSFF